MKSLLLHLADIITL